MSSFVATPSPAVGTIARRLASRLRWGAYAFVPAGVAAAATAATATDFPTVRLLWGAPALLYLASFVVVFAGPPRALARWMLAAQTPLLIITALTATWAPARHDGLAFVVQLATLFTTAMVCHGRLAGRALLARAPAGRGGGHAWAIPASLLGAAAAGAAFAVLVVPLLLDRLAALPILCACAALLRPRTDRTDEKQDGDFPLAATAMLREVSFPLASLSLVLMLAPRLDDDGGATAMLLLALIAVFAVVYALLSAGRPLRFALCLAALAVFGVQFGTGLSERTGLREPPYGSMQAMRHGAAFTAAPLDRTPAGLHLPSAFRIRQ